MYVKSTPTLNLPQYEGEDKLQRADMNSAYWAIDAAIAARPAADSEGRYPLALEAEAAKNALTLGGIAANHILKHSSVSLYVSATGSDTQGDGTQASPFRSVSRALQNIHYHQMVSLYLSGELNETVRIGNVCLAMSIIGTPSATLTRLHVSGIPRILVRDIIVSNENSTNDIINITNVNSFEGRNLKAVGNQTVMGITLNNSTGYIVGFDAVNCLRAVNAIYNSYLTVSNVTGSGNTYALSSHSSFVNTFPIVASVATTLYELRNMGVIFKDNYPLGSSIENPPLSNSNCVYQGAFSNEKSHMYRSGNMVIGNLSIKCTAQVSAWSNILILPTGFRPLSRYTGIAIGGASYYHVLAFSTGEVQFDTNIPANTLVSINFVWVC